jgi:hypothetical protein
MLRYGSMFAQFIALHFYNIMKVAPVKPSATPDAGLMPLKKSGIF